MTCNVSVLPVLIIFDLDCLLLPFNVSRDVVLPLKKDSNGEVIDNEGYVIKHFPEVPTILEQLQDEYGIKIGLTSNEEGTYMTDQILNLFEWDKYFVVKKIYPGIQSTHLKEIRNQTNISFDKMIYFDNWHYNTRVASEIGVHGVYIDPRVGMTVKALEDALKEYELKELKKKETKVNLEGTNTNGTDHQIEYVVDCSEDKK